MRDTHVRQNSVDSSRIDPNDTYNGLDNLDQFKLNNDMLDYLQIDESDQKKKKVKSQVYLKKALSFYKTKSKIVVASPITKRQVSQIEKQKTSTWINLESKKNLLKLVTDVKFETHLLTLKEFLKNGTFQR